MQDENLTRESSEDDPEDYMDAGMRVFDEDALIRIHQIITEHALDLEAALTVPGWFSLIFSVSVCFQYYILIFLNPNYFTEKLNCVFNEYL